MTAPRRLIIAMDGPAGVGKSTVGQYVAKRLGYHFINTGEMFRALTWKALEDGVDVEDQAAVLALARRLKWEFHPTEGGVTLKTFIDGQGVTVQIREERVSRNSSAVAANPGVRRLLCRLQRRLGRGGGIVMEGRDITTHVFPDADFKFYLDASPEERARRRTRQLKASGLPADFAKIHAAILQRDLNDLKRKINPLSQAEDAVVIDSTRLSMRQVAQKMLRLIRARA
ncbi:MAG: (d)CMP kinase [Elusimicrobia bacterium]|nr:(d)CMP kinase [Elusimicrobiota bacterium]